MSDTFELVSAVTGAADLLPTVSIVSPTDNETVWGSATIQVYASDPEGAAGLSVQVRVDSDLWQSAPYSGTSGYYEVTWNTSLESEGSHTIEARATDGGGNTVNSSLVTVTIVSQPPPLASFTATPTSGEAPLTVVFDAMASSDPNGSIVSYDWDYDDGTISSGVVTSHEYTISGSYTVTVTVTDNEGATATATTPVIVGVVAPIDVRVAASSDDAEESTSGSANRTSSDLELVDEGSNIGQTVGMRFNGVGIPPGAAILNAYLQFQVDETDRGLSCSTSAARTTTTLPPSPAQPATSPHGRPRGTW